MIELELCCVAIILLYVGVRARIDPSPKAFLGRLALLMVASWIGENSVIHAYHFYAYSPRWSVFVDQVPLLVITIWPVVIHSAWDLAKRLTDRPSRVVWLASCLVLADASLIEPIAVKAGLWWWNEPGLFEVPPIGILGWALFAWGCFFVFEHRKMHKAWTIPFAPALVHPLLLACWWAFFRWVNHTVPPWPVVGLAWLISVALAVIAFRRGAGKAIPRHELLLRVPAASFFFVLLAMHARDEPALMAYAFAFAPPYLVLTAQARGTTA